MTVEKGAQVFKIDTNMKTAKTGNAMRLFAVLRESGDIKLM